MARARAQEKGIPSVDVGKAFNDSTEAEVEKVLANQAAMDAALAGESGRLLVTIIGASAGRFRGVEGARPAALRFTAAPDCAHGPRRLPEMVQMPKCCSPPSTWRWMACTRTTVGRCSPPLVGAGVHAVLTERPSCCGTEVSLSLLPPADATQQLPTAQEAWVSLPEPWRQRALGAMARSKLHNAHSGCSYGCSASR